MKADGPGGGESQSSIDPEVVETEVGQVAGDHRADDRGDALDRLEALAQGAEEIEGDDAGDLDACVRRRHVGDAGRLVQECEHGPGREEQGRRNDAQPERHDEAALDTARHGDRVARAHRLGDHGVERHEGTHPEDRRAKKVEVAERDGGDRLGRDVAHHDGVDHAHQHLTQLHGHDRQRQSHHGAELGAEAHRHAGN